MCDDDWPQGCPLPPDFLCDAGIAEWRRQAPELYLAGHLWPLYEGAFSAYCSAYGAWAKVERLAELPDDQPDQVRILLREMAREHALRVVTSAAEFYIEPSPRVRDRAAEPRK